jgi:hypothetical protein
MTMMYEAGKIRASGYDWPIYVDEDGKWYARIEGGYTEPGAASREELPRIIARRIRAATQKTEVRFWGYNRHEASKGIRAGTVTGVHAGNSNLLVQWDDGSKDQLKFMSGWTMLEPGADPERWEHLRNELDRTWRELNAYEQDHGIDLRAKTREALADKAE